MHQAVRYGGFKDPVKLLSTRAPTHQRLRNYSSSQFLRQIPEPKLPQTVGAYTPLPQPNTQAKEIAILGGGITGLATAFNLSKTIPNAKITIYDSRDRLGGWIDSEIVKVDDGEVLFEWGPRSLRPDRGGAGKATLHLILQLGDLVKDIRGVTNNAPAATNRYVYYPDHLVRVPTPNPNKGILSNLVNNVYTFATEPIFGGIFTRLIAEPTVKTRQPSLRDESIGDFITRRFGSILADNLVSAVFHGIYAGNIYNLSARQLMPFLWYAETRDSDGNGILAELAEMVFRQHTLTNYGNLRFQSRTAIPPGDDVQYHFMLQQMANTSVYSFLRGLAQLPQHLEQFLTAQQNFKFFTGKKVQSLKSNKETKKIAVGVEGEESVKDYDYVVSTTTSQELQKLTTAGEGSLTSDSRGGYRWRDIPGVNVMVVNLYYQNPNIVPVQGFGYLLPQSIPLVQNPERALGVIFGSETAGPRGKDANIELEHVAPTQEEIQTARSVTEKLKEDGGTQPDFLKHMESRLENLESLAKRGTWTETFQRGQDTASGTKLTVMLGGHWWSGWQESDLPSEDQAIEMAKSVLARHLKIFEKPMLAKARMQHNCIPQYRVGYRDDMAHIHDDLMKAFHGRLKVAGPWWQGGVGVNDCCKKAWETALSIREGWDDCTGLEDYGQPEKWYVTDRRTNSLYPDPLQT